jgi:hypothetical protein
MVVKRPSLVTGGWFQPRFTGQALCIAHSPLRAAVTHTRSVAAHAP